MPASRGLWSVKIERIVKARNRHQFCANANAASIYALTIGLLLVGIGYRNCPTVTRIGLRPRTGSPSAGWNTQTNWTSSLGIMSVL